MRALASLGMAVLIWAGFFAPLGVSLASAPREAALVPKDEPAALRGESPHVELKAYPPRVAQGEETVVTGRLRGYNLGAAEFCLEPSWTVYGFMVSDGAKVDVPLPADKVQCRDHAFSHRFRFTNAGLYGLRLELRTTGSKVRVADQGFMTVEVVGGAR
jgi:hypothetical protein